MKEQSNTNQLGRKDKIIKPKRSHKQKYYKQISGPNVDHLVEIPFARIDSSIRYHLRVMDLETKNGNDQNKSKGIVWRQTVQNPIISKKHLRNTLEEGYFHVEY